MFARTSIATRLTALLALVVLCVFAAVGTLLHWTLQRELLIDERVQLENKAIAIQQFVDGMRDARDLHELRTDLDVAQAGDGDLRIWVVRDDATLVYGESPVPQTRPGDGGLLTLVRDDGVPMVAVRTPLRTNAGVPAMHALVAVHPRARIALLRAYDRKTLLVCALGVVMTVALCFWLARRELRPLRRLSGEAAAIDPGTLSRRLSAHDNRPELMPLVESFNHALDRLEDAYRQLEGFSANVAHELRTPLSVLINGTELALSRERPAQELREEFQSQLEELRALASMVNDMLFLARADRGELANNLVPASLRVEALSVAEYLEASLAEGRQQVLVQGDAMARVNTSLVRRALVNLISNAARYTPEGESIVVQLETRHGAVRVSVCNPGPGIPPELHTRMFDRFWRGDASRSRSGDQYGPGLGLGLAIVRAIARMHGGETFARSHEGITTIGFTLAIAHSTNT